MVVAVIPAAYDALSSTVNVLVARRTVQYVRCCHAIRRCGIVRLTAERDWKDTSCSQAWPAASQHGALAMAGVGLRTDGPVWGLGGEGQLATRFGALHARARTDESE